MAYRFAKLTKGSVAVYSSGGYGLFKLSKTVEPVSTESLVYTLSSDGTEEEHTEEPPTEEL